MRAEIEGYCRQSNPPFEARLLHPLRGRALQVLAALRNAVLHLLPQVGAISCPAVIEQLQVDPDQAKKFIGIPSFE